MYSLGLDYEIKRNGIQQKSIKELRTYSNENFKPVEYYDIYSFFIWIFKNQCQSAIKGMSIPLI